MSARRHNSELSKMVLEAVSDAATPPPDPRDRELVLLRAVVEAARAFEWCKDCHYSKEEDGWPCGIPQDLRTFRGCRMRQALDALDAEFPKEGKGDE
jgi:hypothetical protein